MIVAPYERFGYMLWLFKYDRIYIFVVTVLTGSLRRGVIFII